MVTTKTYEISYVLNNTELQEAINQAGFIVMQNTDKSTSGEARRHAADCLRDLFKMQIERAKLICSNDYET